MSSALSQSLASRAVERSVADRRTAYAAEIERILEGTYRVIQRTGEVDPPLRAVLRECKLSTQAFYKYFSSKDELLVLLLDDGRRRLLSYLAHRMDTAITREGRIREWIAGVLAQASRPDAASRTLPFFANQDRLDANFAKEQQVSIDALIDILAAELADRRDAVAIYHLAFGALHAALRLGVAPTEAELDHLVTFCIRGATEAA